MEMLRGLNKSQRFPSPSPPQKEDFRRLGSGERNPAEGGGPRGPSERERASHWGGVRRRWEPGQFAGYSTFGVSMLRVGSWMLDVGCWMLDVGCSPIHVTAPLLPRALQAIRPTPARSSPV